MKRPTSEDADVKDRCRSSGVVGADWGVVGRRCDRTVGRAFGWTVGERAPARARGGGFDGEAALGVVLALVPARLLADTADRVDEETCPLETELAGFRADAGVALLLTFALARMGGLVRGEGLDTDLVGDGGLEMFVRGGGVEEESLYPNLTVT